MPKILTVQLVIPDTVHIEPSETRLWHLGREFAAAASHEYGDLVGVVSMRVEDASESVGS